MSAFDPDSINPRYAQAYSDAKLNKKLNQLPEDLPQGLRQLRYLVRLLWILLKDPKVAAWRKASILAALGYFISPIDAVPDVLFPVGYLDDLAVLAAVVRSLASQITPEHRALARKSASPPALR